MSRKPVAEGPRLFEDEESLFEVNPSRLQCYLDCPRQYRFRYVEHRPERRTFPHTALGRSVHKALRDFYALPAPERTLPNLIAALRRAWDPTGLRTRKEKEDALLRAEDMLRRFFESEDHAAVRPLALESKFAFPHAPKGIIVTGRVDRLDMSDDGYVIVDYKTGRYRQDAASVDSSLPLSIYAMAVSGRLGNEVSKIVLHHLALGARTVTERGRERLANDWRELMGLVDTMQTDPELAPTPGPLCHWCDYLAVCREGRAEVAKGRRAAPPPEPLETSEA
jgi:RecB family exonuclease